LTQKIPHPKKDTLHRIDYYLNIIEKAGLEVEDRYTEFFISDDDINFVDNFLNNNSIKKDDFLVAINPGGNWSPKRWSKDYWSLLADKLILRFGAKVIITGAYQDSSLALSIKERMKGQPLIACGVFNIKQLAALCKRLDLFITADTGPLHIATSMSTKKIIALFGPTDPSITGPYPLKNVTVLQKLVGCKLPCYQVRCQDNRCMKAITPEEVIEQVRLLRGQ
jgi:ADP-heptose:LPS heptosyltransferase